MKNSKRIWQVIIFVISVILLVALDQFTKYLAVANLKGKNPFVIIDGVFEFFYLQNTGAAWGVLSGGRILLLVLTLVVMVVILAIIYITPCEKKYLPFRMFLILLGAGAFGNFVDRMMNGYVCDFIYFKLINFPIFNVADIYVTISMGLLIVLILFVYKDNDFKFLSLKSLRKNGK